MRKRTLDRIVWGWIILIIIVALVGKVSIAAPAGGRTAADFLQIGPGARASGMGGAFVSISNGAEAAYWNPAALSSEYNCEFAFSHFSWFQDLTLEHGAAVVSLGERVSLGASVTYLGYGQIDGYDVSGNYQGAISSYDWAGAVSIGFQVNDRLSLGVTTKYINQRLDEHTASAFAADAGFRLTFDHFTLAATASHLGTPLTFIEVEEKLPATVRGGISVRPFYGVQAAFEFEKPFQGDALIRHGLEFAFAERYFLRGGYNHYLEQDVHAHNDALSLGAGLRFGIAQLDYAYSLQDQYTAEDLHRFSLTFRLN